MRKNWLPVGGLTVAESAFEPPLRTVKDLFSLTGVFEKSSLS